MGIKDTTQSPFSSYKAPALPREVPAEVAVTPTTTSTITVEPTVVAPIKMKARREFKLESGLHEGALLTELQVVYKKVKKEVKIIHVKGLKIPFTPTPIQGRGGPSHSGWMRLN